MPDSMQRIYGTILLNDWAEMPDGRQYKAVRGFLEVKTAEAVLGHEVNSRDSNWLVQVSDAGPEEPMVSRVRRIAIPGCQVRLVMEHDRDLPVEAAAPSFRLDTSNPLPFGALGVPGTERSGALCGFCRPPKVIGSATDPAAARLALEAHIAEAHPDVEMGVAVEPRRDGEKAVPMPELEVWVDEGNEVHLVGPGFDPSHDREEGARRPPGCRQWRFIGMLSLAGMVTRYDGPLTPVSAR